MPRKLRAATAGEAVEGLKAVEALKAAIEAAPVSNLEGYRGPEAWGFIVYLGLCERMGSAIRIRILEATAALESDGSIEIQGVADYTPPQRRASLRSLRRLGRAPTHARFGYRDAVRLSGYTSSRSTTSC